MTTEIHNLLSTIRCEGSPDTELLIIQAIEKVNEEIDAIWAEIRAMGNHINNAPLH